MTVKRHPTSESMRRDPWRRIAITAVFLVLSAAAPLAFSQSPPGGPAPATQPDLDPDLAKLIDSLIQDLGSPRYDLRERAGERLRHVGLPALAALERAAASDDPETRVRAREALVDVKLGIEPDWPAEIALLARHYDKLEGAEKTRAIARVSDALKERSGLFLLACVAEGKDEQARAALGRLLLLRDEKLYPQVIQRIAKPATDHQTRALAWALVRSGRPMDALDVVTEAGLPDGPSPELIAAAVKLLGEHLDRRRFAEAARDAARLAEAAPADSRFLYLRAEALIALGQDEEAERLRRQALGANVAKESPHFTAGEMLLDMGRRTLAAREFEAILKIAPADDVYDANAHMRLGSIYEANRLYARAAESLTKGLEVIERMRRGGGGVGLLGGTEADIGKRIEELGALARKSPEPAGAAVRDRLPDGRIAVSVDVSFKDHKREELRRALGQVAATVTINVQPTGLRLLDLPAAGLSYDPAGKQLQVTLNGSAAGEPVRAELAGDRVRLAVRQLDCYYIYEVRPATGVARQVARYEKDYRIRITPGRRIAGYSDVKVRINDKDYAWDDLLKGVAFDFLPDKLNIVLEAVAPAGAVVTRKFAVTCREPAIEPLREEGESPAAPAPEPPPDEPEIY